MEHETSTEESPYPAILLLGPTAAGKSPLGDVLEQRGLSGRPCLHFDFGANLREVVRRDLPDEFLRRAELDFLRKVLRSGALLEDEHFPIAQHILQSFLTRRGATASSWIVLNGLPRHVGQARAIEAILDVRKVIYLECSAEVVFRRIATDIGGDRSQRLDDDPAAARDKLAIFRQRTAPLLEYFAHRDAEIETVEVTAEMTPQQAWETLQHP